MDMESPAKPRTPTGRPSWEGDPAATRVGTHLPRGWQAQSIVSRGLKQIQNFISNEYTDHVGWGCATSQRQPPRAGFRLQPPPPQNPGSGRLAPEGRTRPRHQQPWQKGKKNQQKKKKSPFPALLIFCFKSLGIELNAFCYHTGNTALGWRDDWYFCCKGGGGNDLGRRSLLG